LSNFNELIDTYNEINDLINKNFDKYIFGNNSQEILINEIKKSETAFSEPIRLHIPKINFKIFHQNNLTTNNLINISSIEFINFDLTQSIPINRSEEDYEALDKLFNNAGGCFKRDYIINRPFIIFMRTKSNYPFFIAYICNDEVLQPSNDK
jgi:hypothetical protein